MALGLITIGGRVGWSFKADGAFWALVLIGLGAAVLWLRTRDVIAGAPARRPPPAAHVAAPGPTEPVAAPNRRAGSGDSAGCRAPRSYLGAVTWSLLLVLAGVAWLLDASGAVEVDLGVVFALALALVGTALVVSAWFGTRAASSRWASRWS